MEAKPDNNPYGSVEEMAEKLDLTLEEAQGIWQQWQHKMPTDPQEFAVYANRASRYEHAMRLLNSDLHDGAISEAEYQAEARKIQKEIYGK